MVSAIIVLAALSAVPPSVVSPRVRASSNVEIRVTDRVGTPIEAARVTVDGTSERGGETGANGKVTFRNMTRGAYKLRVEREAFITLEKDFFIRRGKSSFVGAQLSPSTARSSTRTTITGPGPAARSRVLFIPDVVEKQLAAKATVAESPIACSGAVDARVIQVREPLAVHSHQSAEEMLYVVAGEATLKIGNEEQKMVPGWFGLIPRGTAHSLERRGRKPVVILSVLGGQPCQQAPIVAEAGR